MSKVLGTVQKGENGVYSFDGFFRRGLVVGCSCVFFYQAAQLGCGCMAYQVEAGEVPKRHALLGAFVFIVLYPLLLAILYAVGRRRQDKRWRA